MNESCDKHGGSSRSHAALVFNLQQVVENASDDDDDDDDDTTTKKIRKTTFTIIDLAGAKQPTKTKEKCVSGGEMIIYMAQTNQEIPPGCEAYVINWELSAIATEIHKATEAYNQK
eukprot:5125200-Ditylum_brightwellii.AAC.1